MTPRRRVAIDTRWKHHPTGRLGKMQVLSQEAENDRIEGLDYPDRLIAAYELQAGEKPTIGQVIDLVKTGKLSATRNESGVLMVDSVAMFLAELEEWMTQNHWRAAIGPVVPPRGFTTVVAYCREHVSAQDGCQVRLYHRAGKGVSLSTHARDLLTAGDVPSARQIVRGTWVAPPGEIRAWLHKRWGVLG